MPRRRGACRPGPELRSRYARDGGGSRLCGGGKARHVVRVTVLGSGDAFGSGGRLHSAYLVETPRHTFLLACGPTILQAFKRSGRDPGAVDFVLLSHLHGDHFGGLPFLFMEYRFEEPRSRPLTVYGPPGTERRARALFGALYERIASEPLPFAVRYEEVVAGTSPALDGVRVLPFVVPHASELRAFAYRIEVDGRTILYSGDSAWTEGFVPHRRGAGLFLCGCSPYEARVGRRMCAPARPPAPRALGGRRPALS